MTDTRVIEGTVMLDPKVPEDQRQWLISLNLISIGMPIEPFTGLARHGKLDCIPDALNPNKLKFIWHGEDWRQ